MTSDVKYSFEDPATERRRLRRLARSCEEPTREVLRAAGVAAGMRCLDMGCGPGEVVRLLADEVGPGGSVVGMDLHRSLTDESLSRTSAPVEFHEVDIEAVHAVPGGPYDVVFSRLLLRHVQDPAVVVRKLYDAVAPGGVLVLQEFDVRSWEVQPPFDGSDLPGRTLAATFAAQGRDPWIARKLPLLMRGAGATEPVSLRGVSWISTQGAGGDTELLDAMAVFLPAALAAGTVDQDELDAFSTALRHHYRTTPWAYQLSPTLVSAWVTSHRPPGSRPR